MQDELKKHLVALIDDDAVDLRFDEALSGHTTFEVGGPADVFAVPRTVDALVATIGACRELKVPFFVLGKGSDLLVADEGWRGVIVCLDELAAIDVIVGDRLVCQPGAGLKDVAEFACEHGLGGFEFACGIPGSIGGACFMNAGAYDGCMADVLESVDVLLPDGSRSTLAVDELDLGYRQSRVRAEGLVVLTARLHLTPGDRASIRAKMDDLTRRREEKQPLEYGSAGSTFKRPEGYFAGKLIMDAGLKGYQVGGAAVSQKHAGFVVNLGGATAADVHAVIEHVQDEVERQLALLPRKEIAAAALENSRLVLVGSTDEALTISNRYAPEHLILETEDAEALAARVVNAGSVFIGHLTPESAGDYASGTNHTLPTNGYATAYSGVNLDAFCRKITYQKMTAEGLQSIGRAVELMAAAEQLDAHKNAMALRLKAQ